MARPAKFTHDDVLDGALAAVAVHGPNATLGDVCAQIGAPVGSIYHRFPTREHLFVQLWLRAIRRFHVGLLEAAAVEDPREALTASAVHIPRYCRDHPDEALALTLYRHQVLVTTAPADLAAEVRTVNDQVIAAMQQLCHRRYGRTTDHLLALVATAVQQCPYGLVRPHVGAPVPAWLDEAVAAASTAILALGDRPAQDGPSSHGAPDRDPAGG
jgi:AcrR family transcriptional regulator